MTESKSLRVRRATHFWGELRPPSDKSMTHRAYLLGAIAERGGVVSRPLQAQDCDDTLACLRAMGAQVNERDGCVEIIPTALRSPSQRLWCGNSGTTMRLLTGLLAGLGVTAELHGDESLSKRPMRRVVEPLRLMGADVAGEYPPVRVRPASLRGIRYESPIASAQVKSAILLAGLSAEGRTTVIEPSHSRDHTERMLRAAKVQLETSGPSVTIHPGRPDRVEMEVPGDISSAAFFMVAAALVGGPVTLLEVGVNPTRTGILDVLKMAGVSVTVTNERWTQGEPVADLAVEKSVVPLEPFHISGALVPRLVDEVPVLAVLATQCDGVSTIRDAKELRVKESDRIAAMAEGLRQMGARVDVFDDGMSISGPASLRGAVIQAHHDHRVAMAFAVAGLIAEGETEILGAESIATSFPDFESELRRLASVA
ncbi:MAG: 3-phosphoshikimate 1-carboxyvinyltransferase [Armatimonadota bacterium]